MPNWCSNYVELTHENPDMIRRAEEAFNRGELLAEFIPVPASLQIVAGTVGDDNDTAQKELERQQQENISLHGYANWYDFCVGEWGTKWDVGGDGQTDIHPDGKMLHTTFDSAWSPPIGAYQRLEELGFGVNAMYFEGGMAYAGAYGDGNDEEINLEGMSADDVENHYPEIDEAFGISESMREYEAENEEELTAWIKDGAEKKALVAL